MSATEMRRRIAWNVILLATMNVPLLAQWNFATSGVPRDPKGKPVMTAPAVVRKNPVHGELLNWAECCGFWGIDTIAGMRDFLVLFVHLIVTVVRRTRPGGLRSVFAESVLVKHQLLILNRGRKRAPNLRAADRILAGLCTLLMRPARVVHSAIVLKPSTFLYLHNLLKKRKYRMLFSPKLGLRPGPKGPKKCDRT